MKDIICPYCNHAFEDNDYFENEPGVYYELVCPVCRKIMLVDYEFFASFRTKVK